MQLTSRQLQLLPEPGHPQHQARRAELERLTEAAGPERALHAYRWLEGSEEHRAAQVDVFVEACSWHPDAPTFGGALSLARELPLDSPDLPARMDELERMVACSTPETGLLAFRELSDVPQERERQVADYVEICSWNSNLGRFGTASKVLRLLDECPPEARPLAMDAIKRLDWGTDWLSCDAALKQLPSVEELARLSPARLLDRPSGEVGETDGHWLIAGSVLKKRSGNERGATKAAPLH